MQLDRPLGAPELRPVEQRRAQIDDRGVQAHQLVLEPELPPALAQGLAPGEQLLEHRPVQLPRPMLVGIGQRGAMRRRDAQVLELALAAAQPPADLPQRVRAPELTEQHGHELPPAREPARVALGVGPLHQGLELRARKQLESWLNMLQNPLTDEPPVSWWCRTLLGLDPTIAQGAHPFSRVNLDKSVVSHIRARGRPRSRRRARPPGDARACGTRQGQGRQDRSRDAREVRVIGRHRHRTSMPRGCGGTLPALEEAVARAEAAPSVEASANALRPSAVDEAVTLPKAMRWVRLRLARGARDAGDGAGVVAGALRAVPDHGALLSGGDGTPSVLVALRGICERSLHMLPAPLGLRPSGAVGQRGSKRRQQSTGPDPPGRAA